jgi:hypothetical protein
MGGAIYPTVGTLSRVCLGVITRRAITCQERIAGDSGGREGVGSRGQTLVGLHEDWAAKRGQVCLPNPQPAAHSAVKNMYKQEKERLPPSSAT